MYSVWWYGFILSLVWIIAGVLNIISDRNAIVIVYNFFAAAIMAGLGICQHYCEKKNKMKQFKYIKIGAFVLVLAFLAAVLLFR